MRKKLTDSVGRSILFATVIVFSFATLIAAGPARLTPDKPKWGDTVRITYDPAVNGAKFLPGDTVYVCFELAFPEFSKHGWAKMAPKDRAFTCEIVIPEGASFIYIEFITMDGSDAKAGLRSMIFRRDGVPAEGAWMWTMAADFSETGYLDAFKNERKLYPDNYLVYRNKWFVGGAFKPADRKAIVSREMGTLQKRGIKESPGLLWTLSAGYLLLDDEKASRGVLRRMVRMFPASEATAWALREYDSQVFSKQIKGEGPEEIKRLEFDLLRKDPTSKPLRDHILLWLAYESDPPLDIVRPGFEAWIADEPENPTPYYTLAKVLFEKNKDLNEAAGLARKALDRLIAGRLRLYDDSSGSMTERALPDYFQMAAAIHEKLNDYSAAIAEIKAAESLAKDENRPDLFMREGSIWRSLGYFDKAEISFLEARRRGAKNADEELKGIYRQRRQTDDGFEAWLAGETSKPSTAASGDKKPAPGFEAKTLDGETLRLADLKGKVVILNFWYIGCAPCRVEMPGLNKLTEEFKPDEIVFIGFASDDESRLREFLKKNPFKYKIVAGSSSIAKLYGVSGYPTHVLINKQGQVEFIMTGGSPDRYEELRPLIQGLLK
jgi:peroxiredoxin